MGQQWKLFRNMFIKKFEAADTDKDLLLKVDEVKESMKDVEALVTVLTDEAMWVNIVNDLSRRPAVDGVDSINFYEWMFLRQMAVAWSISSG